MMRYSNIFIFTVLWFGFCFPVDAYQMPYKIPGPRSLDDKIAIVGAGPAGIHMAYLLKEKGFKHVEILEKSSRLGGKSSSIRYRGVPHEMGTVYLSPDYYLIRELVEKYVPNDITPFPGASIWLDNMTVPIDFTKYAGAFVMKILGLKNPNMIVPEIFKAMGRYQKLHVEIFGTYKGEIMPAEPSLENMQKIRGTFIGFIMRNNLQALIPIFQISTTIQGYGHLDEIAALYGLMWNTPNFINNFKLRMTGKGSGNMDVLKSGFQNLWETMVQRENIQVTLDVDIYKVYRPVTQLYREKKEYVNSDCREVWICKKVGNNALPAWERYDFLIWTPEMKESLHLWKDIVNKEAAVFSLTTPAFFTASLVDSKNLIRGQTPIDYWMDNVLRKRENSVWAQRDSYSVINQQHGPDYKAGKLPTGDDGDDKMTAVVYQMGKTPSSKRNLEKLLVKHFTSLNGEDLRVKNLKTWRYFPRYSPEQMEKGVLWRILEMQGRFNMWYIGSSVCFESVKSVVEYNKLIVENMDNTPFEQ